MAASMIWNKTLISSPPVTSCSYTCYEIDEEDVSNLKAALQAVKTFSAFCMCLSSEQYTLGRLLYGCKNQQRSWRWYQMLHKVQKCLGTLQQAHPSGYIIDAVGCCEVLLVGNITSGQFLAKNVVKSAIVSRIWVMMRVVIKNLFSWYSGLRPWIEKLKATPMLWLTPDERPPKNLEEWLKPEYDSCRYSKAIMRPSTPNESSLLLETMFGLEQLDQQVESSFNEEILVTDQNNQEDVIQGSLDVGEPVTDVSVKSYRKRKHSKSSSPEKSVLNKKRSRKKETTESCLMCEPECSQEDGRDVMIKISKKRKYSKKAGVKSKLLKKKKENISAENCELVHVDSSKAAVKDKVAKETLCSCFAEDKVDGVEVQATHSSKSKISKKNMKLSEKMFKKNSSKKSFRVKKTKRKIEFDVEESTSPNSLTNGAKQNEIRKKKSLKNDDDENKDRKKKTLSKTVVNNSKMKKKVKTLNEAEISKRRKKKISNTNDKGIMTAVETKKTKKKGLANAEVKSGERGKKRSKEVENAATNNKEALTAVKNSKTSKKKSLKISLKKKVKNFEGKNKEAPTAVKNSKTSKKKSQKISLKKKVKNFETKKKESVAAVKNSKMKKKDLKRTIENSHLRKKKKTQRAGGKEKILKKPRKPSLVCKLGDMSSIVKQTNGDKSIATDIEDIFACLD